MRIKDDKPMKVEIPRSLYQAIIRIQGDEDVDWEVACQMTATLVDPRRDEFKKSVQDEANRLGRSQFMKQLNKSRKTLKANAEIVGYDKGYEDGYEECREEALQKFTYPCSICGKPMMLSEIAWAAAKKYLMEAKWHHGKCNKES